MSGTLSVLSILLFATVARAAPPEGCSVTESPRQPFVAPKPFAALPLEQGKFYFGWDDFWTILPKDGVWSGDQRKIAWFSKDYWSLREPNPDLAVDARRLDGSALRVRADRATNGFISEHQTSFMLNSIEFPASGCWEISARYRTHYLKFVVWVTPYIASSN
jgi:hypothetical protein